ncbi:MAG: hypothetical protein VZQ98_13405 [Bacteroidales bacterium]|nr:hypothetical protein [Bacteroidales bacterium]
MNRFESYPFKKDKPIFKQMRELAHPSTYNREEMLMYERSLDRYRIYHITMKTAFDEGYEEGLEEGRKIGIRLVRGCMKDCFRDGKGQDHQLKKKKKSKCVVQRLKKKGLPKDAIDDILYLIDHKGERF